MQYRSDHMSANSEKPGLGVLVAAVMLPWVSAVYLLSAMVSDTLYLHGRISPDSNLYRSLLVLYRPLVAVKTSFPVIDRGVERWRFRLFEHPKNH